MATRLIVSWDYGTSPVFEDMFDSVEFEPGYLTKDDVVLFEGGTDVDPALYGQKLGSRTDNPDRRRDAREKNLFEEAQKVGAACIGVCRGAQLLTVLSGGKLVQHVTGHGSPHMMITDKGQQIPVTSTHHQMCNPFDMPKEDVYFLGWAKDRLSKSYLDGDNKEVDVPLEPEILWFPKTRSLAIQGHPEYVGKNTPFPIHCRKLVSMFIGV
jgi:hypothetical protein